MTLQQDSIKGNLCCNIFQRPGEKISSEWRRQTANLICSPLTGLLHYLSTPLLSTFLMPLPSFLWHFLAPSPPTLSTLTSPCHPSPPPPYLHPYIFFSLWHSFQHVHCHLLRTDEWSAAGRGDRSSDPEWIAPVYAIKTHETNREKVWWVLLLIYDVESLGALKSRSNKLHVGL